MRNKTVQNQSTNSFSVLRDDGTSGVVNTSLPAKLAPKLAPATLASLTSGSTTTGKYIPKGMDTQTVEQPKQINLMSEDDFPSLGGKPATKPVNVAAPSGAKFSDMARSWAKKKEKEEEDARKAAAREELRRRERELFKTMPMFRGIRRREDLYHEDDEYNPTYEDDYSIGDDSCELPDENEEAHHDGDEEEGESGEFNQNIEWDGRRRDDLY